MSKKHQRLGNIVTRNGLTKGTHRGSIRLGTQKAPCSPAPSEQLTRTPPTPRGSWASLPLEQACLRCLCMRALGVCWRLASPPQDPSMEKRVLPHRDLCAVVFQFLGPPESPKKLVKCRHLGLKRPIVLGEIFVGETLAIYIFNAILTLTNSGETPLCWFLALPEGEDIENSEALMHFGPSPIRMRTCSKPTVGLCPD